MYFFPFIIQSHSWFYDRNRIEMMRKCKRPTEISPFIRSNFRLFNSNSKRTTHTPHVNVKKKNHRYHKSNISFLLSCSALRLLYSFALSLPVLLRSQSGRSVLSESTREYIMYNVLNAIVLFSFRFSRSLIQIAKHYSWTGSFFPFFLSISFFPVFLHRSVKWKVIVCFNTNSTKRTHTHTRRHTKCYI